MDQKEFDQLLKRYLQGDASEEERALIDHWYRAIEHASSGITSTERSVIRKRLQSALKDHKERLRAGHHSRAGRYFSMPRVGTLGIAASVTVILAIGIVLVFTPYSRNVMNRMAGGREDAVVDAYKEEWKEIENTSPFAHVITFQDGSEITLERGGLLEYPRNFGPRTREVRLKKGRAFFNVARDERRPFYVYSRDVVTKVLGTSFMINSDQKGHVTVDVKTGSVSVSARSPAVRSAKDPEIILKPNQRAAYDPDRNEIVRTAVANPEEVVPSKDVGDMTFEKAPLTAVFGAMEKAYHVKIGFDKEKFSSCALTTYLIPEEDLYTRLRIICEAINATYVVEDGKVIINGKGCS